MSGAATNARVSHRGQTTLPANLRRRWGIEDGGEVGVVDLGSAALFVPGGIEAAKAELFRVLQSSYLDGLEQMDDSELHDQ